MDAKRVSAISIFLTTSYVYLAPCGCATPSRTPVKNEATEPPPEPPQVVNSVNAPTSQAADAIETAVQTYIERVQNATQLQPLTQTSSEQKSADNPPPLFSDQPASTRPAPTEPEAPAPVPVPQTQPTARPPELATVVVRPAEPTRVATRPAGAPDAPAVNAPMATAGPLELREILQQHWTAEGETFREQLDRRMLCVLAGDYEGAREPLTLVTAEQQALARRFVEAWIVIRECHMGDPAASAASAARELGELQQALRRLADMSVPVVAVCSAVRGFGQYELIDPPRLPAGGAEFVLYCEVRDFVSQEEGGVYTTRFDLTTTVLNRAGDVVLELKDVDLVDRCRNPRHDCFIPRLVRLPATLPPGSYTAKVTVVDRLGQKMAENRTAFQLVAR